MQIKKAKETRGLGPTSLKTATIAITVINGTEKLKPSLANQS